MTVDHVTQCHASHDIADHYGGVVARTNGSHMWRAIPNDQQQQQQQFLTVFHFRMTSERLSRGISPRFDRSDSPSILSFSLCRYMCVCVRVNFTGACVGAYGIYTHTAVLG